MSVGVKSLLTAALMVMCLLAVHFAYVIGRGQQKGIFLSTHIYAFERFTEEIARLSEEEDCDELKKVILYFNREWRKDPQSPQHIVEVVRNIDEGNIRQLKGFPNQGSGLD